LVDCNLIERKTQKGPIMPGPKCPSHIVGRIFYFAFIGFIAILLVGPVIGILSVVLSIGLALLSFAIAALGIILPFAILGFLVWAPLHAAFSGKPLEWRKLGRLCKGIFDKVFGVVRGASSMMTGSGRIFQQKLSGLSSNVGVILFETFCGALVGLLLAVIAEYMSASQRDLGLAIIGLLIGAVLGALVGTSRIRVKEPRMEHSAEGIN
jgi:hypothetical protein